MIAAAEENQVVSADGISTDEAIERLEERLLALPQIDFPLKHDFSPGIYLRSIFMPVGAFVIGHRHKTEHLNIIMCGRANVVVDGRIEEIVGPCVIKSGVGVRKILYILEPMIWATVHATDEIELAKLEDDLIVKSAAFLSHQERLELDELKRAQQLLGSQT